MRLTVHLVFLLGAFAASGYARTWSGSLVDAKCYAAEERNVNPTDTELFVDRDRGYEIRYCSPKPKTKSFAVVSFDGASLILDSVGNAKAFELVQKAGKERPMHVTVTGEIIGKAIQVDSITPVRGKQDDTR
jgi:hypothetical protein